MSNPCGGEGMPQLNHPNETYCTDEVKYCRGCEVLVCRKHVSDTGYCGACLSEFVMRIKCQECGIGRLSDGMCACPTIEPLTLAALDVCLCLDGVAL
jgi:hypothetical protein